MVKIAQYVIKSSKERKRKPVGVNAGKSTAVKGTLNMKEKLGIKLKGSDKAGYILTQDDGVCYQDMALTPEELKKLYIILERKFGEFIGYKIK